MLKSKLTKYVSLVAVCAALAACSSVDPVPYSGIASSPRLRPNPKDDAGNIPYSFSPQVDWRRYDRVKMEPVVVYRGPDNQFGNMSEDDKAQLAHHMQDVFAKKLSERFSFTNSPGPGTLVVKLTLTGATTNTPVISPVTHIDLAGNLYNGIQAIRGGQGMISGSVMYEVEIFDTSNGALIYACVSKQYPGAMDIGASFGSLAAAEAGLDKGADVLVEQLTR